MTVNDTALKLENPYWDEVEHHVGDGGMLSWERICIMQWDFERGKESDFEKANREELVQKYSWAMPNPRTLGWMVKVLAGRSLVEVGAGTGYWAWMLSQCGVDVKAYDVNPPNMPGRNQWHPRTNQLWHPVEKRGVDVVKEHSDRVLFLCWPPYSTRMGYGALKHYRGENLIYLGEGENGCNGDENFWELFGNEWEEVETGPYIPWQGLNDRIGIYERKTTE